MAVPSFHIGILPFNMAQKRKLCSCIYAHFYTDTAGRRQKGLFFVWY